MSKAAKLIIVILFLLLGISVFVVLTTLNQKQTLEKNNQALEDRAQKSEGRELKVMEEKKTVEETLQEVQTAKTKIEKDLDEANGKVGGFTKQITDLNTQLLKLTQERDELKGRFESLRKERDDLMVRLDEKPKVIYKEKEPVANPAESKNNQNQSVAAAVPAGAQGEDYWAGVLKEKASLDVQLAEVKNHLSANGVATAELKKQNSDLELELTALKNDKTDLERKMKYNEDLANNLSLELARTRNDRQSGNEQLDQLRQENEGLRSGIKSLTTAKMSLEKSIARLMEDKNTITRKLDETQNLVQSRIEEILQLKDSIDKKFKGSEAEAKQTELKPMIDDLLKMKDNIDKKYQKTQTEMKEVQLQPIIVSAAAPAVEQNVMGNEHGPSGFEGHIVSVNDPNNFVIVDLGENSGIKIGDRLNVYRDAQYIAGLEIIQVRQDICAADIKEKNDKIQAGDVVR